MAFSWRDEGGVACDGLGVTRDISEYGVYVFTATSPPAGSSVEVRVPLSARAAAFQSLLKGQMQVMRTEEGLEPFGGLGFALAGEALKLGDGQR